MKCVVKSNLQHDGVSYKKGQELELDEKRAAHLIRENVVAPGEGEEPQAEAPPTKVRGPKAQGLVAKPKRKRKPKPKAEAPAAEEPEEPKAE